MTEKIEEAISAHLAWLKNIKTAVLVSTTMGKANSDPELNTKLITKIESDHQCNFGKWLFDIKQAEVKESIYYDQAVTLHAQFHQQAASILSLAFEGKKSQAKSLMSENSDFIQCSEELIAILEEWKANS